jgi:queuine tRNA-ribosyltransferase
MPFEFSFTPSSFTRARLGLLETPHGVIETPAFIFCATKGAIKGAFPEQMKKAGTQIILCNTYHMMLQPGGRLVEKMGGLHRFIGWDGPMLTDSGGFQIFSLGHGSVASEIKGKRMNQRPKTMLKITEEGAYFKSYIDGQQLLLTPEKSIEIQRQLGADLIVVLDECTPFHVDKTYTENSMHLSHRWALRSLKAFQDANDGRQALYGIVQGGVYEDLRRQGADFVNAHPFFGHAVGGCLGGSTTHMHEIVEMVLKMLNPERPIHLLGIGGISDIFNGVEHGVDTFDCVHPTRLARHGGALVKADHWSRYEGSGGEHINLKNKLYREDERPIDEACLCSTCQNFSRAYLHHLLKAHEMLALQALTLHNVHFMNDLLCAIRSAVRNDTLHIEKRKWVQA